MDWREFAKQEAIRQGVDPSLVLPLVGVESNWNSGAVSPKGAAGLMQLMPATARDLGLSDADRFNPSKAIPAGVRYLKQQLDTFGSPDLALAAYNAGPGAVKKAGGVPSYPETQNYVRKNAMADKTTLSVDDLVALAGQAGKQPSRSLSLDDLVSMAGGKKPVPKGVPPSMGESLVEGLRDPIDGGAQWLESIMPTGVADAVNRANNWLADKTGLVGRVPERGGVDQMVRQRKDAYEARRKAAGETSMDIPRIAGNVAALLPTAFIPGANTMAGSALVGAGSGAMMPVTGDQSRVGNAAWGAAGGVGGQLAGRAALGVGQGVKSLLDPFFNPNAVAAKTLQRFSLDPAKAVARAQSAAPDAPGVQMTLGEASLDSGLAQLQRSLFNLDPHLAARLTDRQLANNAARVKALSGIAKDDMARDAAVAARDAASGSLYKSAGTQKATADDVLMDLMNRPSLEKAFSRAQKLAKEKGETISFGQFSPAKQAETGILDASGNQIMTTTPDQYQEFSGNGLHYLKMALDDLTENPATNGIGSHELRAMQRTKADLLNWTDNAIPDYGAARKAYADLSKPINQMDVGRELLKRSTSATEVDQLGNPMLYPARFASAVRDSSALVKKALGRKETTLPDVLTPDQMALVRSLSKGLSRKQAADNLARTAGSDTAKNLASLNVLRQTLGPLGMPQSLIENSLLGTVVRPAQMLYNGVAEPRIQSALADMMLDPAKAAAALKSAAKGGTPAQRALLQTPRLLQSITIPGLLDDQRR